MVARRSKRRNSGATRGFFWTGLLLLGAVAVGSPSAAAEYSVQRDVAYGDGPRQRADLYLPKGAGPHPTVLMIHGGAWMTGDKTWMNLHARAAAKRGYAVVSINYRLAPKNKFPAQVEDTWRALAWLRANADKYEFDKRRIAIWGYSAGAHLACMIGLADEPGPRGRRAAAKIRAIVAGGTPCDFRNLPLDLKWLAYWLGGTRREKPEVYKQASPAVLVSKDDPPVFLFHGEKDFMVPGIGARAMGAQLKAKGVRAEMHRVRGAGHMAAFLDAEARKKALDFLDSVLRPAAANAE